MAEQKRIRPSKKERETEVVDEPAPKKTAEQLKAETDELLDEIDEVLAENAAEFVQNYVQKGGQ